VKAVYDALVGGL